MCNIHTNMHTLSPAPKLPRMGPSSKIIAVQNFLFPVVKLLARKTVQFKNAILLWAKLHVTQIHDSILLKLEKLFWERGGLDQLDQGHIAGTERLNPSPYFVSSIKACVCVWMVMCDVNSRLIQEGRVQLPPHC
uniref:Uncharacterized protein n=1 Tax=Sphaerodactylus townsendi TaxID=933632 RepID=A0ACB8EXJ2_9SAUR